MAKRLLPQARFGIISPLFPFYFLGLTPGQVLWPLVFIPLILTVNFAWALILATTTVVLLGQTERVGQRLLVRYAAWATIAGVIINLGHDVMLVWLGDHVDFLLETQPWRLMATTFVMPCIMIFLYHWLLSWQYLRLRVWQAAIMGIVFALLTAPWTTLVVINHGQGRLPVPAQRWLLLSLLILTAAAWLLALSTKKLRHVHGARLFTGVIAAVFLAALFAAGGGVAWARAVTAPSVSVSATGFSGNLAFTTRGRLYAARASGSPVQALGRTEGQVIVWSPNERFVLVNEVGSDGKTKVVLKTADGTTPGVVLGEGQVAPGAWAPDSSSFVYVTPTDTSGQIHLVRVGGADRIIGEGRSPSWSPDGRRISYSTRSSGRWQVWVMLPTGSDAIQLTTEGGEDPVWSPDGRYIAYILNNRVQVMDADGNNKRRLPVDNTAVDLRPLLAWSGDGARLAYIYVYPPESGRPAQIYIWETITPAIALGGGIAPLTTPTTGGSRSQQNYSGDFRPPFVWSPDGVSLGFLRGSDMWTLNVRSGEEKRMLPADSYAWGGRADTLVVRPAPTYPPTPTPTPLPPAVVESPIVLALSPKDPTLIMAGTASGVVRKVGGGGWFLMNAGISYPTRVHAIAFDSSEDGVVYAGTDGQRAVAGGLYKSTDNGQRWTATSLRDADVYCIIIDQRTPKTLYVGTSKGVYVSSDEGANWILRNNGLKTTSAAALALDPSPASGLRIPGLGQAGPVLYLGTRQGEVYKSTNGGSDWKLIQTLNSPVTGLAVSMQNPITVFASTEDGLFDSIDSGETWNQISGGIWKVRLDGIILTAKVGTLYTYGIAGVFVSHDGGTNWGPAAVGLEGTQPSALVAHPSDEAILYVGTDRGMFRTSNGGVTWLR